MISTSDVMMVYGDFTTSANPFASSSTSSLSNETTDHTSSVNNTMVSSASNDVMKTWPKDCLVIPMIPGAMPLDNAEDLVASETQDMFSRFLSMGLLTLLFVVGSPANIVNMIVFYKQGLKERINVCLFSLSLADFLIVTLHFAWGLDWVVYLVNRDESKLPVLRFFINNYIIGLAGFIYVSSFLSMVIAVERCFCVLNPFKAQGILRSRTMAIIIVVVAVIIVGVHFILAAQWRIICIFNPISGASKEIVFNSQFYFNNTKMIHVVNGIVYGVLIPGLCLTGVSVSTLLTVLHLKKMAAWRGQSTSASASTALISKDVALTRMLIGISFLYIVCTTPAFLFHTAILFVPELSLSGKYKNTFKFFINMQQAFTYINSSVNIFIYYTTGTKYRTTLQALCCKARAYRAHNHTVNKDTATTKVTDPITA